MLLSLAIFVLVYVLIAFEIVDKVTAALAGASAVLILQLVPYEAAIAAIDMNVVFLLIGMMIVMGILADTGALDWLAITLAQRAKGDAKRIVLQFLLVTAVLSAFLDNVTTVILIAPITILITQLLEVPTAPVLILTAIFSNIGGTATLIGDPPNIVIGSATHLTFNDFLVHLGPIIVAVTAVCLAYAHFQLGARLDAPESARSRLRIAQPELAILDASRLRRSLVVLGFILAGFFAGHAFGIEPGIVALGGGTAMVIVCRADIHDVLPKIEWGTILFFIGLFLLISALEHNQVFRTAGHHLVEMTSGNLRLTAMAILWVAAIASAIVDNIPLVIAMIPLIEAMVPDLAGQAGLEASSSEAMATIAEPLFWSLALGACLGGNGTLIGASANIVIAQIANRNRCPITFWSFTRSAFGIMLTTLVLSSAYVCLRYF